MNKSIKINSVIILCLFVFITVNISEINANEKDNAAINNSIKKSTSSEIQLSPEVLLKQSLELEIEDRINNGLQTVPPPATDRELTNGINCDLPIVITSLPFADAGQTTCGKGNDYENTCLDYYDNGEDIIYELEIEYPGYYSFDLYTYSSGWSGMMLSEGCPDTGNCIVYTTSSSAGYQSLQCVFLDMGVYYIMIDTWPSPECIPEFDFNIDLMFCDDFSNNNCEFAEDITEPVSDVYFTTIGSTNDGPGGCITSGNIWFTHTALADDYVMVSLCESNYDTKLAIYEGDDCSNLSLVGCNDDNCELQSELYVIMEQGKKYYIEIGGYSDDTGEGVLSIYYPLHDHVECSPESTPEGEECGDAINDGCNVDPPVFGSISCGEFVCGNLWADDGYRDTDWYELTLEEWSIISLEGIADLPFIMGIVETQPSGTGNCDDATGYLEPFVTGDVFEYIELTATLPPGTYWIFLAPEDFYSYSCENTTWDYEIILSCETTDPSYCEVGGGCDEYIAQVIIEDIDNITSCDGYSYFTFSETNLYKGIGYPITILSDYAYSGDDCAIWIDWNHDFDMDDPGERITMDVETGYGPFTATITPPFDADTGLTIMRIRLSYFGEPENMHWCGITTFGEVEDYIINVSDAESSSYLQDPDPFMSLHKFALDPIEGHLFLSDLVVPDDNITEWQQIDLLIGECVVPIISTEIISGGWGELFGNVLDISFDEIDYIECQESYQNGLIFNEVVSPFDIYYEIDGVPNQWAGEAVIMGHRSGDLTLDGEVNVSDLSFLVNYIFRGGDSPRVLLLADVDGIPGINIGDLTYLVSYIFRGGPDPQIP